MEQAVVAWWLIGECALVATLLGIVRLAFPRGGEPFTVVEVALILLLGLACLVATPEFVTEFWISPDSLEYVAGARSFVERGAYALPFHDLIPRYPPWFSAWWIAPVLLGGGNLWLAILPVTCAGVVALLCSYQIGRTIGGSWGGILSALFLLLVPGFVFFSRHVLIDIPMTTLGLAGALVYLRLGATAESRRSVALLGGAIVAWATLLRPTGLAFALPLGFCLLQSRRGGIRYGPIFLAPIVAALALGLFYNKTVFGDFFRNGYHYWCAIPYDFLPLTFGLRYIQQNFTATFVDSGLGALLLFAGGGLLLLRRQGVSLPVPLRSYGYYLGLAGGPLVLFYLVYFFPAARFIVPVAALVAVYLGALMGLWLERRAVARRSGAFLLIGVIALVLTYRISSSGGPATKGLAARTIAAHVPTDAVVISGIDPVYLSLLVGQDREYVPISRRVEYASKYLTPRKLELEPAGIAPRCDNPDPRLVEHGAHRAVERVALEDLDYFARALAQGRKVFIDTSRLKAGEGTPFELRFRLVEQAPQLFELTPRTP